MTLARFSPRPLFASFLISITTLPLAGAAAAADPVPNGLGAYLAGRQAQRDKRSEIAARYLANALAGNRENGQLLTQAFVVLMMAGDFTAAEPLARDPALLRPAQGADPRCAERRGRGEGRL